VGFPATPETVMAQIIDRLPDLDVQTGFRTTDCSCCRIVAWPTMR
jgi:hypothetical protein